MNELTQIFSAILKGGGTTTVLLGLCSAVFVGAVIERLVFLARGRADSDALLSELSGMISDGRLDEAEKKCKEADDVFRSCAAALISRSGLDRDDLEAAAEATLEREMAKFERNVPIIGTTAVIAPFIGLMGTVIGIMTAFADIASAASAGPAVVAKGVSEALAATAAGLMIAIPASIMFNYFKAKTREKRVEAAFFMSRLLEAIFTAKKAGKGHPDGGKK